MAVINKMVVPVDNGQGTITNEEITFERSTYYGTCTGQASNQIKAVTISNDQGFELKTGVLIFVKFDANNSYSATSSSPIKLNVNNTGAKQIYAANTSAPTGINTTYFGRNNYINQYIYNGTYWVWNGSSSDNTINTQLKYADAIKAAAAITASTICVGTSAGYKTAASGITFDISYPMLYAGSAVDSGSTNNNVFRVINNRSAESLKSGFSGVAHSLAYLVLSSISGNIATIDSTVYTVTPNVEGKFYISIGIFLNNTTNLDIDLTMSSIYIYEDGELKLYGASSNGLPNEVITYEQFRAKSDSEQLAYTGYVSGWPGSGGGSVGILPHLIVISETGSTVTATKGQTVITATETSTGHFECDLPEFGTWTIDAILGGDDATVNLVVDTVKVYTVDDSHFHATVTVKYPTGATCRLQSADETLYATGSPYTFTVHHAETYTITVTYNQRIYTDTVTFTTEGQSFSKTLPSPSEVDANDINWWLWFGGVSGTFSSLEEILANSTALSLLMASTDAVDYLVRCTDWASNEGLVPVMTSNTTPSGACSAQDSYSGYPAYYAFDGKTTTLWRGSQAVSQGGSRTAWIQYKFDNVTKICAIKWSERDTELTSRIVLSASNDGSTFTDIETFDNPNNTIVLSNAIEYQYYRLTITQTYNGTGGAAMPTIQEIQFYKFAQSIPESQSAMSYIGLNNYCANTLLADSDWCEGIVNSTYMESVLNIHIPAMTSDTTPSGHCYANNVDTGYNIYSAMDKNDVTGWCAKHAISPLYLYYQFTNSVKCLVSKMVFQSGQSVGRLIPFDIIASNDGTNWTTLDSYTDLGATTTKITKEYVFDNDTSYEYYGFKFNHYLTVSGQYRITIFEMDFYGRADV